MEKFIMNTIKLSNDLITKAQAASATSNRSLPEQIEHWIKIGKLVEENPDLNYAFIKEILIAKEEANAKKLNPYES